MGLKDAKEYVEKIEAELRKENPDAFPEKKGCASVLMFGFISTATAVWAIQDIVG